jgi:DNA invertase Pin-like site-specific DNA recombinase
MRYRAFIRASDERQDQATQEAAIGTHVSSQDYVPAGEPYRMDGSAYHNKQVKLFQRAIDDMLAGEYDVLVCSASSRLWRGRSAARAVVIMDEAEEAGARFDFAGEPHISTGGTPPEYMEMMRLQAFQVNRRESDMKSERARNTYAMHKATGAAYGREPWGTVITCEACGHVTTKLADGTVSRCGHKHAKQYTATDDARRLVPQITARAIKGESTMSMSAWLSQETGTRWHETLVGRIIRRGAFYAELGLVLHADAAAALAAY